MSEFNKLLFIINKFSGSGLRPKLEGKILTACEQHQAECTIQFTTCRGHATDLAKEAIGKYDAVIAVGGDGTVNEIAQGLLHSKTPLGILPKGSGNGLARHLGIPMNLEEALQALFNSKTILMDTFNLNNRLSVNVSGIGFDGHVANLFGENKKRGFWGYARFVISEYIRFAAFEASRIQNDTEEELKQNLIIAIANSSQYGNNARVSPGASVTDKLLHLVSIKKIPLYKSVPFAYRLFTRTLQNNTTYRSEPVRNLVLQTSKPVPFHVDGEPCGADLKFEIKINPASLPVLVPEKSLSSI
ncbi:MAG: diacylglycerol kinase family lipid kinase [Flammeovirgaceae bacterium]|nr:MAG: diacylglycerol kinase family lipid kinase [Flammeovirgaceae bacterium]